ncbi:CDP-diacylglycerol pyrophosphatase [Sodalis ligni]|uniref:CDP-diacylglycerol pyrophosphatase n=2 Tax=Sodalis ligni TaxID=2697027 RepID=A0A4R1NEF8_9GAMM|nr:CDP-diacylglycerol pyrophosphatase [Sodalis ligni]
MMKWRWGRNPFILFFAAVAIAASSGFYYYRHVAAAGNPDALWQIVSQKCVPHQQQLGRPDPCREVNLDAGYTVLKDLEGPLQYLLIPVEKIVGIESPVLLNEKTPNFFYHAWQARQYLTEKAGAPVPDRALALAINSPTARSQNQLHIHISCLRPEVRRQLDDEAGSIGSAWQPLPAAVMGHSYLAKRITAAGLAEQSPFITLAREVPGAAGNMGHFGLALAQLPDGSFALLANQRSLLHFDNASTEEIQDHSCAILRH